MRPSGYFISTHLDLGAMAVPVFETATVNPGCPPSKPHIFFIRLLFDGTFEQPNVFALVKCVDIALMVFYSPVLTRCRIYL